MLTLKNKAGLEALQHKMWMYKGTTYLISDFTEVNDQVIISTDIKAIRIPADQVDDFLKELLPVDAAPAKNGHKLMIPGVEAGIFTEITGALMTSLREIQGSKDPKFLKEATDRAKSKVMISKAVTDVAKTVIAGQKAMQGK